MLHGIIGAMSERDDADLPDRGGEIAPAPDVFATPERIASGIEQLEKRIPEFVQLSVEQKRTKTRAAHLDPEFVRVGIEAAARFSRSAALLGRDAEELRRDEEDVRRWDEAIRSVSALLDGMVGANLTRRHRLGNDILRLYRILGILMSGSDPEVNALRPYYEEMKRLYQRFAKVPKRRTKAE